MEFVTLSGRSLKPFSAPLKSHFVLDSEKFHKALLNVGGGKHNQERGCKGSNLMLAGLRYDAVRWHRES